MYSNIVSVLFRRANLLNPSARKTKNFIFKTGFRNASSIWDCFLTVKGEIPIADFSLVEYTEGFEIKGLAWPGRERDYDLNSQVPTGYHNGREIFYVFGRYPADLKPYSDQGNGRRQYPVVDLVICHGDFLNADHNYVHKNKSVKGFGTYGDIMIRDRKMYVAPTPFALTEGTTGLMTLILPERMGTDSRYKEVGRLTRTESETSSRWIYV